MWYVYILKGQRGFVYVGFTNNLLRRLGQHNEGLCRSTKYYRPFNVEVYIGFKDKNKAASFEKYLKSHSGSTFMRKRIL